MGAGSPVPSSGLRTGKGDLTEMPNPAIGGLFMSKLTALRKFFIGETKAERDERRRNYPPRPPRIRPLPAKGKGLLGFLSRNIGKLVLGSLLIPIPLRLGATSADAILLAMIADGIFLTMILLAVMGAIARVRAKPSEGQAETIGNKGVAWGIAIIFLSVVFSLAAIVLAGYTNYLAFLVVAIVFGWGGTIWGAWKIVRGWKHANVWWRVAGSAVVVLVVANTIWGMATLGQGRIDG